MTLKAREIKWWKLIQTEEGVTAGEGLQKILTPEVTRRQGGVSAVPSTLVYFPQRNKRLSFSMFLMFSITVY